MKSGKALLSIIVSTIWISLSEFLRNQFLVNAYWVEHYKHLGLTFPSEPVNGAMWGIWSLLFAIAIFIISGKFNLIQTALLAWFVGFVMMWVVIGNLGVLPFGLLGIAIPLSMLEAFVAAWIVTRITNKRSN